MNPSRCFDCSLVCSICYSVCFSARLTASIHGILSTAFSLSLFILVVVLCLVLSVIFISSWSFLSSLSSSLFISLWIFCFLLIRKASDWNNCPDQESLLLLMSTLPSPCGCHLMLLLLTFKSFFRLHSVLDMICCIFWIKEGEGSRCWHKIVMSPRREHPLNSLNSLYRARISLSFFIEEFSLQSSMWCMDFYSKQLSFSPSFILKSLRFSKPWSCIAKSWQFVRAF